MARHDGGWISLWVVGCSVSHVLVITCEDSYSLARSQRQGADKAAVFAVPFEQAE